MVLSNVCLLCMREAENIDHLVIHCLFAIEVWNMLIREIGLAWVFLYDFLVLFMALKISGVSRKVRILWDLLCLATWCIWLERNQRVFEGCVEPAFNVYKKAKDLVCFSGLNYNLGDVYSVVTSKRDWPSFFL